MNKLLLMSYMIRNGDTQESLAKAMNLSLSRLNAKINERSGAVFDQVEMQVIIDRYSLSADEAINIFFAKEVS